MPVYLNCPAADNNNLALNTNLPTGEFIPEEELPPIKGTVEAD